MAGTGQTRLEAFFRTVEPERTEIAEDSYLTEESGEESQDQDTASQMETAERRKHVVSMVFFHLCERSYLLLATRKKGLCCFELAKKLAISRSEAAKVLQILHEAGFAFTLCVDAETLTLRKCHVALFFASGAEALTLDDVARAESAWAERAVHSTPASSRRPLHHRSKHCTSSTLLTEGVFRASRLRFLQASSKVTLEHHAESAPVTGSFESGGNYVCCGTSSGRLRVMAYKDNGCSARLTTVRELLCPLPDVSAAHWCTTRRSWVIVASRRSRLAHVYDVKAAPPAYTSAPGGTPATPTVSLQCNLGTGTIGDITFFRGQEVAVGGTSMGVVNVWDIRTGGKPKRSLEATGGYVDTVQPWDDGTTMILGSRDGKLSVWDMRRLTRSLGVLDLTSSTSEQKHIVSLSGACRFALRPEPSEIVFGGSDGVGVVDPVRLCVVAWYPWEADDISPDPRDMIRQPLTCIGGRDTHLVAWAGPHGLLTLLDTHRDVGDPHHPRSKQRISKVGRTARPRRVVPATHEMELDGDVTMVVGHPHLHHLVVAVTTDDVHQLHGMVVGQAQPS